MLDHRTTLIAKQCGIMDKITALHNDLSEIHFVTDVEFDLSNYSEIPQVIFLLKYDIHPARSDYWAARSYVINAAKETADRYWLCPTGDSIEDYGEHFYFVFSARNWKL